eukprot:6154297-Lingulodinium_polyedra.AAC.1
METALRLQCRARDKCAPAINGPELLQWPPTTIRHCAPNLVEPITTFPTQNQLARIGTYA